MTSEDVILNDWIQSSYDDRFWQNYCLGDFVGSALVDYEKLSSPTAVKEACYEAFSYFDEHPTWHELSKELAELIHSCYLSDNDMWFVDEDDEWLENVDLTALQHEINYYGLDSCVTIYDNDAVICVYSGAQEMINLKEAY